MAAAQAGILPDQTWWPDGQPKDLQELPAEFNFVSAAVPLDSATGQRLQGMVAESLPAARVASILRFGNRRLWAAFQFQKANVAADNDGNPNVRFLFHGARDPAAIVGDAIGSNSHGFDVRLAGRGDYGRGAYFAAHAAYPVQIHPRQLEQDGFYSIIVAEVALGAVMDYGDKTHHELRRPPVRKGTMLYNSVRGTEDKVGLRHCTNRHAFGEQFVIYERSQAYPHFLLRVQCKPPEPPLNLLRTGCQVAFYGAYTRHFLQMRDDEVGSMASWASDDVEPLHLEHTGDRFTVVDAGEGLFALYCNFHQRFMRMWGDEGAEPDGGGGPLAINDLPPDWPSERWRFVDVGRGKVALWNPHFRRFLRMEPYGGISASDQWDHRHLPEDWHWERFVVIPHPEP